MGKKLIITGTGRCGSSFIHNVLTDCEFKLGKHEHQIKEHGGTLNFGWNKYISNESIHPNDKHDWLSIGLVRSPLQCISSLTTISSWDRHNKKFSVELKKSNSTLHKSMLYYYHVNNYLYELHKNNKLDGLFGIDHLNDMDGKQFIEFHSICNSVKKIDINNFRKKYVHRGTKFNSRKHKNHTINDLKTEDLKLYEKIEKLAQKLNYSIHGENIINDK